MPSRRASPAPARPEQLAAAGALWREHRDCLMQTHIAEIAGRGRLDQGTVPRAAELSRRLRPSRPVRARAVFGHGIWLDEPEMQRLHESGAAIAHCPTSNFFLGSGAFDLARAVRTERPVRVGLGTDIGAGTSFSILATLDAAYKASQLNRQSLSAGARLLSRHPRLGPGAVSRRQDRQHRRRHGSRSRGARHAIDAADRFPHGPAPGTSPSSSSSR